jgi:phosphatidate phosphatase LPIN
LLIFHRSDALGHVLNMIGRDWTHLGVAKLYTDIAANGYNILYLTSRSVGQADTTRGYLHGVTQEGYKLPRGPVILSPDRTMAALRREVYLRKPEVFKMACLRDIMNLFQEPVPENADPSNIHFHQRTPFYAGFGNRLTDALSYRSVAIPPTRIFTINSNAEVNLHLLTLNSYRASYLSIWELVDHYFPPVGMLVKEGGEDYTDFNYWRDKPRELFEYSASESSEGDEEGDDGYDPRQSMDVSEQDEMEGSFISESGRESLDGSILETGVLDTVEEEDEFEGHDLRDEFITEEPEEENDDDESGDILVQESRQLEALDLEAEEDKGQGINTLKRFASSPDSRPNTKDGVDEDNVDSL